MKRRLLFLQNNDETILENAAKIRLLRSNKVKARVKVRLMIRKVSSYKSDVFVSYRALKI